MKSKILSVLLLFLLLTSCIMQSPKYTTLEKAMTLQPGMPRLQVEQILGVQPYDIKTVSDTVDVFIYVYRVTDRRTLSFNTKPVNGKEILGKYVQLDASYTKGGNLISIETCRTCPDNLATTSKIDVAKILVFVTVTLPVLLVYFGLQR